MNTEDLKIVFSDDETERQADFLPIIVDEEKNFIDKEIPDELPILPIRNSVLYPGVVMPITVGRYKSTRLLKEANKKQMLIGVVAQKDGNVEDPTPADLFKIGTAAIVLRTLKMPDGTTTVIIQGTRRFEIVDFIQSEPYFKATVQPFAESTVIPHDRQFKALIQSIKDLSLQLASAKSTHMPHETGFAIRNIDNPRFLVNFISSNLEIDINEKQSLLSQPELAAMAAELLGILTREIQMQDLKQQIQSKVKFDIDKQQREYFLNQQLRTIQEELGGSPNESDIKRLKAKAVKKKWSAEVAEVFEHELNKLQSMNPQMADYSVQYNYLDCLVDLPWNEFSKDNFDLKHVQKVLDKDHYGLEKVKERIIEFIAVLKLKDDMKSPILCLVGPPGVGKTSLGKSVAKALGRKYVRMSLGGVRDESELRGHRKTYIGAMPGRIIQSLRKAKTSNPVFVLDEIDKVSGNNINGDPQAALLEILDPEQNSAFHDNFVELDYDLSKIMFIATANTLSTIHPALRDRMEVIDISGYLREEKYEIAKSHLIPKQTKANGLSAKNITFPKDIIFNIIDNYTREAGVRGLERQIAKIIRHKAMQIVVGESEGRSVTPEVVSKSLGVPFHHDEDEIVHSVPGVAIGLAWTSVGGEILSIETSLSRGSGNLSLTGNLGDVMKESATIAYEFIKSHAGALGIKPEVFEKWNVHIHVPEGATPKDGPSAGITMLTALTSAFTQRRVKNKLAMTGEITLRGRVLPVGGIKEKILAAKRNNIESIIMSVDNERDMADVKPEYIDGIKVHYVSNMLEVLELALEQNTETNTLDYNKYLNTPETENGKN